MEGNPGINHAVRRPLLLGVSIGKSEPSDGCTWVDRFQTRDAEALQLLGPESRSKLADGSRLRDQAATTNTLEIRQTVERIPDLLVGRVEKWRVARMSLTRQEPRKADWTARRLGLLREICTEGGRGNELISRHKSGVGGVLETPSAVAARPRVPHREQEALPWSGDRTACRPRWEFCPGGQSQGASFTGSYHRYRVFWYAQGGSLSYASFSGRACDMQHNLQLIVDIANGVPPLQFRKPCRRVTLTYTTLSKGDRHTKARPNYSYKARPARSGGVRHKVQQTSRSAMVLGLKTTS